MDSILSNKDRAVTFLQMVAKGNVKDAYHQFASSDFLHHNPFFKGDAASLMNAMEANAEQNPDKRFEVKRTIAEGEQVVVHSHVKQNPEDPGAVVVHIFRFQDGLIAELWDVGQLIPEDSPNENGVF
ncbi:nuclear transport factor 2 family protein [Bacillus sp. KH172YL63]|uniref:nuclear transport factor 2 family protein n=1 Tax=Bacillus sp. KH172YL63 TaxID=2709784 RepID=UPI0013E44BFF|nr:nuclear transport factor 2 family protein [Bacillus sp. KH172YL63]BCB03908.1 polyketide cyclase [Bacillus sp. KH172YL63]